MSRFNIYTDAPSTLDCSIPVGVAQAGYRITLTVR